MVRFSLVFFLLACAGCGRSPEVVTLTGATMGTTYSITVVEPGDAHSPADLEAAVEDTLQRFNAAFSNWDPESDISRFNARRTTEPVSISPQFQKILTLATEVHTKSGGRFDLTVGPLVDLWGFGTEGTRARPPSTDAIAEALEQVGQDRVLELDREASSLRKTVPEAEANLSAIAKGSGIDAVAGRLMAMGLENLMVEVGGDLFALGEGPTGVGWRIAVERPDAAVRTIEEVVTISAQGMATSGDYRNFFEAGGVRYAHIIDPTTGRPAAHNTASVTVIAESAAKADAWATALLVLGEEEGMVVAEREGLAALFITRSLDSAGTSFGRNASSAFSRFTASRED